LAFTGVESVNVPFSLRFSDCHELSVTVLLNTVKVDPVLKPVRDPLTENVELESDPLDPPPQPITARAMQVINARGSKDFIGALQHIQNCTDSISGLEAR